MATDPVITTSVIGSTGEVVVHVDGEVDLASMGALRAEIASAISHVEGKPLLDCRHLTVIRGAEGPSNVKREPVRPLRWRRRTHR